MKFWKIPAHIEQLNEEVGELRDLYRKLCERVARLEADMGWIKWLTMGIAAGVLALVLKAYIL